MKRISQWLGFAVLTSAVVLGACTGGADVGRQQQALLGHDASAQGYDLSVVVDSDARAIVESARQRFQILAPFPTEPPLVAGGPLPPRPMLPFIDQGSARASAALAGDLGTGGTARTLMSAIDPIHVADPRSGADLAVRLTSAGNVSAEQYDEYQVFRGAVDGADRIVRTSASSSEDFVVFEQKPSRESVSYRLSLPDGGALRLVENQLEVLDKTGTPTHHMSPPVLLGARGHLTDAVVSLPDCAYDTNESAPWQRAVTPPGAATCQVDIAWGNQSVTYPAILDPAWSSAGSLATGRYQFATVVLPAGNVLAIGGYSNSTGAALATCELSNTTGTSWTTTGSLPAARAELAAVVSGSYVVASGGASASGGAGQNGIYRYTISSGGWQQWNYTLITARKQHTMSVDPVGGSVLIAGGVTGDYSGALDSVEQWGGRAELTVASLPNAVGYHQATIVPNLGSSAGRIAITGGYNANGASTFASYYTGGNSGTWNNLGAIAARYNHAAAATSDGRLIVAGGQTTGSVLLSDAQVRSTSGTWTSSANALPGKLTQLSGAPINGDVMFVGGVSKVSGLSVLSSQATRFFAATSMFSSSNSLSTARYAFGLAALPSQTSIIAVSGSSTSSNEIFQLGSNGQPCSAAADCVSNICSNNVCCSATCSGACQSCSLSGSVGTCATDPQGTSCGSHFACDGTATTCPSSCSADTQCASGYYCNGSACTAQVSNGSSCSSNHQCTSGVCVGTTCCNTACGNACQSCTTTNAPGTCTTLPQGTACGTASLVCDGSSTSCPSSCSTDAQCASGHYCNGSACAVLIGNGGTCSANHQCASGTCQGSYCENDVCSTSANCASNSYCNSGHCALKLTNGTASTDPTTCSSGHVADGYCCTSDCTNACDRCDVSGAVGTCSFTPPDTAGNPACSGGYLCNGSSTSCPTTCSADADCSASTYCNTADHHCEALLATGSGPCKNDGECGAGHCISGTCCGTACTSNECASGTCVDIPCTSDSGCASTAYCSSGLCQLKLTQGASTTVAAHCASGLTWVDGVCCNTACSNACDRCDVAGSVGTCIPSPMGDPGNAVCSNHAVCDGVSTSCPSSCVLDSDCAIGAFCNSATSQCSTVLAQGSGTCTADDQCATGHCVAGICCNTECGGGNTPGDGCGTCSSGTCVAVTTGACATPIPPPVMPVLAPNSTRDFYDSNIALYAQTQSGATATIARNRATVLRGVVLTKDGYALPGVTVDVLNDETTPGSVGIYGSTSTRLDGQWDLIVNGGGPVTVRFRAQNFITAERTVVAVPLDYAVVPTVKLMPVDPTRTLVTPGASSAAQFHTSGTTSDGKNTLVFFQPGTRAYVNGQELASFYLHASEATTLADSQVMPGANNPGVAFTYAADFGVEAPTLVGGGSPANFDDSTSLHFYGGATPTASETASFPVVYVSVAGSGNAYLGVKTGAKIPYGWFDRAAGLWRAEAPGTVVTLLSNGTVDTDGDNAGDNTDISSAELSQLNATFGSSAPKSLWRIRAAHFSLGDCNWGEYIELPASYPPSDQPPVPAEPTIEDPVTCEGSILDCSNLSLGERHAVVGTPIVLSYTSARQRGRAVEKTLSIPIGNMPSNASAEIDVWIAGQHHQATLPYGKSAYSFQWDGLDAYGRAVRGHRTATTQVSYVYQLLYADYQPFGYIGYSPFPLYDENGVAIALRNDGGVPGVQYHADVSALDDLVLEGLGGWTPTIHHTYDPVAQALYLGDGTQRKGVSAGAVLHTEHDVSTSVGGDIPTNAFARGPDGVFYFGSNSQSSNIRLAKYDSSGSGAESAILNASQIGQVDALKVGPDGALYAAVDTLATDSTAGPRIIRIDLATYSITTIAGAGARSCPAPNSSTAWTAAPANTIALCGIRAIDFGSDGTLYFIETDISGSGARLHAIRTDGNDDVLIGTGSRNSNYRGYTANGWLAAANDGSVVYTDGGYLYRYTTFGERIALLGAGTGGKPLADGMLASDYTAGTSASPFGGVGLDIGADGSIYFDYATNANAIMRLTPDGHIVVVAGSLTPQTGDLHTLGSNVVARGPYLTPVIGFEVAASGQLYFAADAVVSSDPPTPRIASLGLILPGVSASANEYFVPSEDGDEVYVFDVTGRHERTVDGHTGLERFGFQYDSNGYLSVVDDLRTGVDQQTHFSRSGSTVTITGPYGHVTTLTMSSGNGSTLSQIAGPGGATTAFNMTSTGLMTGMVDPRGYTHFFEYDSLGRATIDSDPEGGTQTLSRVSSTQTQRTSGEHRAYNHIVSVVGDVDTRTDTAPISTLRSTVTTKVPGSLSVTNADGSSTQSTTQPSLRFGMSASLPLSQSWNAGPNTSTVTYAPVAATDFLCGTCSSQAPCNSQNFMQPLYETMTYTDIGGSHTRTFNACNAGSVPWVITESTPIGSPTTGTRSTTIALDTGGRVASVARDGIYPMQFTYDATLGKITSLAQGPSGAQRVQQFVYSMATTGAGSGQLQTSTDPLTNQTSFDYGASSNDARGLLRSVTMPGRSSSLLLDYDASRNLSSLTPPSKGAHQFTSNGNDQTASYQPPTVSGTSTNTTYVYDHDRQMLATLRPDGSTVNVVSDGAGRVTARNHATRNITYGYEGLDSNNQPLYGRLLTVGTSDGETVTFGYAATGSLPTTVGWSGQTGGSISLAYDAGLRVSQESINSGTLTASFLYDEDSLLKQVQTGSTTLSLEHDPDNGDGAGKRYNGLLWKTTLSDGSATLGDARTYNGFGELATYTATQGTTTLFSATYDDGATHQRDKLGRIARLPETLYGSGGSDGSPWSANLNFTYDAAGRLTSVADDTNLVLEQYTYDDNGNRTSATNSRYQGAQSTTAYTTYDEQDRLTGYGTTSSNQQTFTYTANGERLTKVQSGVTTTYAYDAFGNLLSVVPSSGTRVDYVVDGLGHRVGRKVGGESTASTQFLWDGALRIVASANSSGTIQQRYIYATHANVPDLVIDATNSNKVYRVVTDHLGSVRMVVGLDDGVVKERHSYDAWGNELSGSYGPAYVASGWTRVPFGFAGGLYDATTGLYRFGARDYDPIVGRWLSKDAGGLIGGLNMYQYANNDPVNWVDINGFKPTASYASADAAALAALKNVYKIPDAKNNEYAGNIYTSDGKHYGYSKPVPLDPPDPMNSNSARSPIPSGCTNAGSYHTHMSGDAQQGGVFSTTDKISEHYSNSPGYIVDKDGSTYKNTPTNGLDYSVTTQMTGPNFTPLKN